MGQTTFYSKRYTGWPPVPVAHLADPSSSYWHECAEQAASALNILFTAEQKEIFATAWDSYGSRRTWQEAAGEWSRAAEMLQAGTGVVEILEELALMEEDLCACVLPENSCPQCRPEKWDGEELPY